MKRFITSIVAMATIMVASAMSYSQAREQAWFLTDKMAYELYLTNAQVDAVYEINLDYIMNVDFMGDIFGTYWERRTKELSFVLTNSQMHTFLATEHFYRPITWVSNSFHFTIYDRYPVAKFYRSTPVICTTYKGENRHRTDNRFEGKFGVDKPAVTGRTLSNRTGASTAVSGMGNGGSTINNGRTRPSGGSTMNSTTNTGSNSSRSDNKVTVTRTEPKVTSTATGSGSLRTGTSANRTVSTMGSTASKTSSVRQATSTNSGSVRRH